MPSATIAPAMIASGAPAYEVLNPEGRSPAVIVADHAGRAIPAEMQRLGLDDSALERHIAYDIGIDALTRILAERLDAPAILHRCSRLIIDPNRHLDDPTSIPLISDDVVIPGNQALTSEERARRAERFFWPYHQTVGAMIEKKLAAGVRPSLISMHSFTPVMRGERRPWHAGVLWGDDGRFAAKVIAALRAHPDLVVGENEPYSGFGRHGYTVDAHAHPRGLANALIEIRQDLIGGRRGVEVWAELLTDILGPLIREEAQREAA